MTAFSPHSLAAAAKLLAEDFRARIADIAYVRKGILCSEMLFFAVCVRTCNLRRILESARARGRCSQERNVALLRAIWEGFAQRFLRRREKQTSSTHIVPGEVATILIIQVSRIGDTLLSTPTIRAIAAAFPAAAITCLGHPKRAEVLQHLPFLQRVGSITKRSAPWRDRWGGKHYDLAFVFGYDLALVRYALRIAKKTVAFRQQDAAINARLFHIAKEPEFQSRHALFMQYALIEKLGIALVGKRLSYRIIEAEAAWAREALRQRCGKHDALPAPLIGVQVASFPTKGYRDWPIEHFAQLCDRIREHYPKAHFVILGGKLEHLRTRFLHSHLLDCSTHLAGNLSLRQSAAIMGNLDLYIGVDTGPTHIMGALNRPMVVLYHPYSPSRMLAPLDHPCLYAVDHPRVAQNCGPETSMAEVPVSLVWSQVQRALTQGCPQTVVAEAGNA